MERHPVSTAFFFVRPSELVYQLFDRWASHLTEPHVKGDQPPFTKALRGYLSKAMDLAILPMAAFPSGKQSQAAAEKKNEVGKVRACMDAYVQKDHGTTIM